MPGTGNSAGATKPSELKETPLELPALHVAGYERRLFLVNSWVA
jgi:hypothetical protein